MQAHKNAGRFSGFADTYAAVRPVCPAIVVDILRRYLGRAPETVVDLGCGTGLSMLVWKDAARRVIGVEPNDDMRAIAVARSEGIGSIEYIKAFSDAIPLPGGSADIVACSQSFHWMEPASTLAEVNRLLKPDGVFAAYDCDWPPACSAQVDKAYEELFAKVYRIEEGDDAYKGSFIQYPKGKHLANIKASGYFGYAREIVFMNAEPCDAARCVGIARSQSRLQAILAREPELVQDEMARFKSVVDAEFADGEKEILFCYRMRIGVK